MFSAKASFFPPPLLQNQGHFFSFLKRKPFPGPDSEIRGKSSQIVLKNDRSLSQLFTSILDKKGVAPALYKNWRVRMSFQDLDEISTRMAKVIGRTIKRSKATPNFDGDTVIAFILDEVDSPDERVIALIFAILKLGMTFMALSPSIPLDDLGRAMTLVKPVVVVTPGRDPSVNPIIKVKGPSLSQEMDAMLQSLRGGAGGQGSSPAFATLLFEDLWMTTAFSNVSLDRENLSESLQSLMTHDLEDWSDVPPVERTVGIFFTSGSVSTPHAVRIGAGEILNRIHWQSKIFPTLPSDAFALSSPLWDPRSLVQIFTPLLSGKPLTLLSRSDLTSPATLVTRVAEVKLTRLTLTPPLFEGLVDYVGQSPDTSRARLASVTHWTVSGGRLKVETGRKFFSLFSGVYKSGVFLISMYGMTETGGEATFEVFYNGDDLERKMSPGLGTLSVGSPITNSAIAIVDRFDKFVPLGERGEVVISGGCLSTGGYVAAAGGQGHGRSRGHGQYLGGGGNANSINNRRKSLAELRKQHILFRTGDIGRIILDPVGAGSSTSSSGAMKRLYIEDRLDNETIQTGGETVNLKLWVGEVMATKLAKDAAVITYHRGRDTQVTVAAVVLLPDATCIQVLTQLHERVTRIRSKTSLTSTSRSKLTPGLEALAKATLPTIFAVDKIPLLPNGRVDKKEIRNLFRKILVESEVADWDGLELAKGDKAVVKFICKAVALSTGLPLALVIRRFGKSFAELGGTPLNAVIVVKMCHDSGFPIKLKDFICAKSIGEVAELMKKSKIPPDGEDVDGNNPKTTRPPSFVSLRNDFDEKIRFYPISMEDPAKIIQFLKNDCPIKVQTRPQDIVKYWKAVVDGVRPLGMSIVAKMGATLVGLALTGDSQFPPVTPKPPKDISYGLELLESCLAVSKYEMWRSSLGRVARSYFVGVTSSNLHLSPGEKAVLIEELLERSCRLAKTCHYSSLVISTANPVIQETAIHLQKFQPLLEFPASRFKARDGSRPFAYADDNHTAAVLIKKVVRWEKDAIISTNASKTDKVSIMTSDKPEAVSGSRPLPSSSSEASASNWGSVSETVSEATTSTVQSNSTTTTTATEGEGEGQGSDDEVRSEADPPSPGLPVQ